ncbi:MAG: 50S ribosomal protein L17 [Candidatus Paceibacterota bacterium]|jgi:large subunit ribosomal protein L17
MRHGNANRKFGREKGQREALLKTLAVSLILKEKIKTTTPKAKEIRPFVEKLITKGKANDLASRRLVESRLGSRSGAAKKVFDILAPKYAKRAGGYLRITKLVARKSDGSPMAQIEFV